MTNNQTKKNRQDFWGDKETLKRRKVRDNSEIWTKSGIQNGKEIKSHVTECTLTEEYSITNL